MSKSMQNMTNLVNFEFEIQNTAVTVEGWSLVVQTVDKLFKFRAAHIKISYNRFERKEIINQKVKIFIRNDAPIKTDLVFVDNEYFSLYLRKKPLPLIKVSKVIYSVMQNKTFCSRLYSNCPTSNHYMCLTCK
jgi:hypothetical protein